MGISTDLYNRVQNIIDYTSSLEAGIPTERPDFFSIKRNKLFDTIAINIAVKYPFSISNVKDTLRRIDIFLMPISNGYILNDSELIILLEKILTLQNDYLLSDVHILNFIRTIYLMDNQTFSIGSLKL